MSIATPHDPALLELVADRLKVIAEPTRIRILTLLEKQEASVQELTEALDTSQQNVSRHLSILYQSGIVRRRRHGTWVHYSLNDYTSCRLIEQVITSLAGRFEELVDLASSDD